MNETLAQMERELLGHLLSDNAHFHEAAEVLAATDFALDSHQRIFCAIAALIETGKSADLLTVSQRLGETGEIAAIGGCSYVMSLTEGLVHSTPNVASRVEAGASLLRSVGKIGHLIASQSVQKGTDPDELITLAEERLLELQARSSLGHQMSIAKCIPLTMSAIRQDRERRSDLLGLTTGVPQLNKVTRGIQAGEIWIVGSGSGAGKTSLLVQMTVANCSTGIPVQLFSLEMTREQLIRRMLAAVSGVPFFRVRDPRQASEGEMNDIARAAEKISTWPLHIEDAAGLTISKIVAKARLALRRHGVKLIGVDYAQIVNAPGKDERLRVASISRALTALAKEEHVAVVALSQLSRADRSSPNRRPRMSDLRESSQLENDAHVVVLLHREVDEEFGKLSTSGELIIAKQRSGETGAFPIIFDKRSLTFREASQAVAA